MNGKPNQPKPAAELQIMMVLRDLGQRFRAAHESDESPSVFLNSGQTHMGPQSPATYDELSVVLGQIPILPLPCNRHRAASAWLAQRKLSVAAMLRRLRRHE